MKSIRSWTLLFAPVIVIATSFTPGDAQAVVKSRIFFTNAAGICHSALPVFETSIRKRPLALQNEGSTNAFITCAFTSQGASITQVEVFFSSNDNASHDISCTGVSGINGNGGSPQYAVKSTTMAADGIPVFLIWLPVDFGLPGNFPVPQFSLSCNLPAGAGINDSAIYFSEDVSA